jgi:hypothetical protein
MFKGGKVLLVASHSILVLTHIAIPATCNALSIRNCDMQQAPLFVIVIYVKDSKSSILNCDSPIPNCDVHQKKVRAHLHIVQTRYHTLFLTLYRTSHHSEGEDVEAYSISILSLDSLLRIAIFRMSISFSHVKPARDK